MAHKSHFYITTTLPYVNADPHLGHVQEFVYADIIARWKRLSGEQVFFNIGTDEHGQKVFEKAQEEASDTKAYADRYAARFKNLADMLHISYTNFIRTTDRRHIAAAEEFWRRCRDNGDIYKALHKTRYCVGCELEKTDSELVNGCCPLHPNKDLDIREEENYFFRFSTYQDALSRFYGETPDFIIPASRFNEAKNFVAGGLRDFSISRLKEKMPWGIPVPDDPDHVMYVWFEALVNYVSTVGWPDDMEQFNSWWPVVQLAGKDQIRMQAIMWQAMLMSARMPPSKQIAIHGFITQGGQKMSKSTGNVADPVALAETYGAEALRYYLAREISTFEDGDFTEEKFTEAYNANLANGLGNLAARILNMAEKYLPAPVHIAGKPIGEFEEYNAHMRAFEISKAADAVWAMMQALDARIQETQPFKLVKENPKEAQRIVTELVSGLYDIAVLLSPILPEAAAKIQEYIGKNKKPETLFARIEA